MADAVVSVFLQKLVDILVEEGRFVVEFRDELEKMKRQLQLMQSFLKDADRLKRKNQTLRTIMDGLRELIFDAEAILADCQIRPDKQRASTRSTWSICFIPSELPFRYETGKRLQEINERIREIKEDMRSYLAPSAVMNPEQYNYEISGWSSPIFDQSQIVGLEDDVNKIKGWLFLENGHGLNTVGIVGMGGLGKTTTAQKVFNDKQVDEYFERKMWVYVSQTFREEEIMRSMLRNLGDASMGDGPGELLRKINQYLLDKKYLLVLDDVWSTNNGWWIRLYQGLPKGSGGSIIVTTRIEGEAKKMGVTEGSMHRPKLLTEEESWSLFSKIAFAGSGGRCPNPDLKGVGKEIVKKCNGLPLAIKAVGGMMLCKCPSFSEWRRIADNFRDELQENDSSVMASLQLSYDELTPHLKSCFLCFSIYPEDCIIPKEQLMYWWIGEGFVPKRNHRTAIESAEDCFLELLSRCLVEAVDKSYNGKAYTCKIHDMVRDLVTKIATEEAFCELDGVKPVLRARTRHWGLSSEVDVQGIETNSTLQALLSATHISEVNKVSSLLARKLSKPRSLRVLDLSKSQFETHIKDLLNNIGSLKHLSYLSLRNTHPLIELPFSLEKLSSLQILDLGYCHSLRTLPMYITTLKKLAILDVSSCGSLEYMPKGLEKLSNLQVLLGFRPASSNHVDGCRLSELKSLTQIRILELRIKMKDEIKAGELSTLAHLQRLQILTIHCCDGYDVGLGGKLDRLSLPPQLQELSLKFYPGDVTPSWLNPSSLPNLQYLSIYSGKLAGMSPRFWDSDGLAWKVEGMMLESLFDLEVEWWRIQQAMPLLKRLSASWCPKLVSFPIDDVGFKGGVWMNGQQ